MKGYTKIEIIEKVNEVIKDNSLSSLPIDLNQICTINNITVDAINLDNLEARLQYSVYGVISHSNATFQIFLNEKDTGRRQRFTLAHELGHFFLHLDKTGNQTIICSKDEFDWLETEANNFAAELLMPRELFLLELLKLLEKNRMPLESCKARIAQDLSDIFAVPLQAAEIRIKEIKGEM